MNVSDYENTRWKIVGVLETDADYQKFLARWRDPPNRCKCGVALAKGRQKCEGCRKAPQSRLEYQKGYREKRRERGH